MSKSTIAVALSGGVDSAIAAYLLKNKGLDVIGVHMVLTPEAGKADNDIETNKEGIDEIKEFCHYLGIGFHTVDLRAEFKQYVIDYFLGEYSRGRTPNPCVVCNKCIKFGFLFDKLLPLGVEHLATGHYARVNHDGGIYHLMKGKDSTKDQSYMLYRLEQEQLSRVIFPVGEYNKQDVIALARKNNLKSAQRRSSQDICFIKGKYASYLQKYIRPEPGDIVDKSGKILGKHKGLAFYTIGQRYGLEIASNDRIYVTRMDPAGNRMTVGSEDELFSAELLAEQISWIAVPPSKEIEAMVKIRYKSAEAPARLFPQGDGKVRVEFHQPQRAISPGQSAVFYQGDEVIGGGIIAST